MLRVLVVDPDLESAQTLATVLHALEHSVQFALEPRAALDMARRFLPDIVVLEVPRALEDGADLVGTLHRDAALGAPRLWAIGAGDAEARRRARESGCEQHLVKPVDYGELVRLVEAAEGLRYR